MTKSQKMEIFYQTRNAMNVGMTYFGSRGFCGAIGVSFSLLYKVMESIGRLFKRRQLRRSVPFFSAKTFLPFSAVLEPME